MDNLSNVASLNCADGAYNLILSLTDGRAVARLRAGMARPTVWIKCCVLASVAAISALAARNKTLPQYSLSGYSAGASLAINHLVSVKITEY